MRYAVHDRNGWPLAMISFSTTAWKLAPRDRFIEWTPRLREQNLPLVVDNPRFLILLWIEIPSLGSHVLAIIRRRLPEDWTERYNATPMLIKTFVETLRHTGAVYESSGWIHVGATQRRGRYDRQEQYHKPLRDVWLRPCKRTGGARSVTGSLPAPTGLDEALQRWNDQSTNEIETKWYLFWT